MTPSLATPRRSRYLAAKNLYDAIEDNDDDPSKLDAAEAELDEAIREYRDSDEPRTWSFGGDGGDGAPDQFCRSPDLQALAESGSWAIDAEDGSIAVKVYATCEETGEMMSELCVIDPDETECPLGDHEWSSDHDLVGGCEPLQCVLGHGAGIGIDEVCVLCGAKRTHYICTHAETVDDHDAVWYQEHEVSDSELAAHHQGQPPQAAIDEYDGDGSGLVDACLAWRIKYADDRQVALQQMVADDDLPVAAVAKAIQSVGRPLYIMTDDDACKGDGAALRVTSQHILVVDIYTVATWTKYQSHLKGPCLETTSCSVGSYGANGVDRIPERIQEILSALDLEDVCTDVPEPDDK